LVLRFFFCKAYGTLAPGIGYPAKVANAPKMCRIVCLSICQPCTASMYFTLGERCQSCIFVHGIGMHETMPPANSAGSVEFSFLIRMRLQELGSLADEVRTKRLGIADTPRVDSVKDCPAWQLVHLEKRHIRRRALSPLNRL
jgi:hypothetical protein